MSRLFLSRNSEGGNGATGGPSAEGGATPPQGWRQLELPVTRSGRCDALAFWVEHELLAASAPGQGDTAATAAIVESSGTPLSTHQREPMSAQSKMGFALQACYCMPGKFPVRESGCWGAGRWAEVTVRARRCRGCCNLPMS
jgi:hypothetical protein